MGTPEFPNLGKHCSVEDCRLIDFLPFTCDCCHKVFCLDHRSYITHKCPKAGKNDLTVVICPLCAKGVHLVPDQDPNITWESHINTDCDPSNYEKVTRKRKCPVPGCRELLTFSNTIKCRDCIIDHCLKHRFGPDHKCPGPKKPEPSSPFLGFLNPITKQQPSKRAPPPVSSSSSSSSSRWASTFLKAASSVKASAEAGMTKLSNEIGQAFQAPNSGVGPSRNNGNSNRNANGQVEQCPLCYMKFSSAPALVDHVQKIHGKNGVMKVTLDVCPMCSKGFRDPVALVEHVERVHRGSSKA